MAKHRASKRGKGRPSVNLAGVTKQDWQIAELLADRNRCFALWVVARGSCLTRADFAADYRGVDFDALISDLVENGFLRETKSGTVGVTKLGDLALADLASEPQGGSAGAARIAAFRALRKRRAFDRHR